MGISLPKLTYPITREYPWPLFSWVVTVVTVIALAILITLNVAVTGYETIITQSNDFYAVDTHWWNTFAPAPIPGSLCSPQNFSVGEILITSNSFFQWTLISPDTDKHSAWYVSYSGLSLDSCDIVSLAIEANVLANHVNTYATVGCTANGIPSIIRTSWAPWGGDSGGDFSIAEYDTFSDQDWTDVLNVNQILWEGSTDLLNVMDEVQERDFNYTYEFYIKVYPKHCPKTWAASRYGGCVEETSIYQSPDLGGPDSWDWTDSNFATGRNPAPPPLGKYIKAIKNLLQVLHAAVRLDIGLSLPNNVLTNSSMINTTIFDLVEPSYGSQTSLYQDLLRNGGQNFSYPMKPVYGSTINASFACRFKYRKSWPELLTNVLVATVTMFMTGWTIIMSFTSYLASSRLGGGACVSHDECLTRTPIRRTMLEPSTPDIEEGISSLEKFQDRNEQRIRLTFGRARPASR